MNSPRNPPPEPDRFSDDPWERRFAELLQAVTERNRRILHLEDEVGGRDARLAEAVKRLRETEAALESQESMVAMSAAGQLLPARPDVLARLASEKGALEARERQLIAERLRLLAERNAREQALQLMQASLEDSKRLVRERDQRIADLDRNLSGAAQKLQHSSSRAKSAEGDLRGDLALAEEHLRAAEADHKKAQMALVDSEQQAELYRKNLLAAEETLAAREQQLGVASKERDEGERDARRLNRTIEFVSRQRDDARLSTTAAEATAAETERRLARIGLEFIRAQVADRQRQAELGRARSEVQRTARERDRDDARARDQREQLERELRAARVKADAENRNRDVEIDSVRAALQHAREQAGLLEGRLLATQAMSGRAALLAAERTAPAAAALAEGDAAGDRPRGVGSLIRWIRGS